MLPMSYPMVSTVSQAFCTVAWSGMAVAIPDVPTIVVVMRAVSVCRMVGFRGELGDLEKAFNAMVAR